MARGIQATAGIGRNTSSGGSRLSSAHFERPMSRPSTTPRKAALRYPANTRARLLVRCGSSLLDSSSDHAASTTAFGVGT